MDDGRLPNKIVGHCIYCGACEALSEEHIVPFALWGDLTLKKASCAVCAAQTSKQELQVLRGFMLDWRTVNQSPTRRKKNRPVTLKMRFGDGQREWTTDVPSDEAIAFLVLPLIDGPAILTSPEVAQMKISGHNSLPPDSPAFVKLIQKHNATSGSLICDIDPFSFCAVLVKIAYAYAAYCETDFSKYELFAPKIICEQPEQAWRFVSSAYEEPQRVTKGMHAIAIREGSMDGHTYLVGCVQLFSRFGATPYHVLLGKRI